MRPAGGLLPFQHNELEFSTTRMSALGHKRTSRRCCLMSALPPKSGHWNSAVKCPLCAKSRHRTYVARLALSLRDPIRRLGLRQLSPHAT